MMSPSQVNATPLETSIRRFSFFAGRHGCDFQSADDTTAEDRLHQQPHQPACVRHAGIQIFVFEQQPGLKCGRSLDDQPVFGGAKHFVVVVVAMF
jgi:hypothetical protein